MYSLKNLKPRTYQNSIFNKCKGTNCLVILPTGIGKTLISLLITLHRLNKYKDSKALICSPTKPLCNQHVKTFRENTTIPDKDIILYTGLTKPEERSSLFKKGKVIIATPQTIQKDLENNRISLEDFSILTIDEAHRSRTNFANTILAGYYFKQSINPRILALTASPGSSREKIREIMDNLNLKSVEIRTEEDEDVRPYLKKKDIDWIEVELPEDFKKIMGILNKNYISKVKQLKKFGLSKPSRLVNKKDLINFQRLMQIEIRRKNFAAFSAVTLIAQSLKLSHAMEILGTQGLEQFNEFMKKVSKEKTKASKAISSNQEIKKGVTLSESLLSKKIEHPKMFMLKETILSLMEENKNFKIMVFANYRNTVRKIVSELKEIKGLKPIALVGQKEGVTQKKQLQTIRDFEKGEYNLLVGTSIMEEGIDIFGGAEIAIFYDSVPSEIRKIQRTGRVGRIKSGRIVCLIAKGTRDEAYKWTSYRKEKKMKSIIGSLQREEQRTLKEK